MDAFGYEMKTSGGSGRKVIYDGDDLATLEKNFRGAVDEYLAFCEAEGKVPNIPFKGSVNVRLTKDLHRRAARFAEEHDLKLNSVINNALQQYLAGAE